MNVEGKEDQRRNRNRGNDTHRPTQAAGKRKDESEHEDTRRAHSNRRGRPDNVHETHGIFREPTDNRSAYAGYRDAREAKACRQPFLWAPFAEFLVYQQRPRSHDEPQYKELGVHPSMAWGAQPLGAGRIA
jgi:hypothetical protein